MQNKNYKRKKSQSLSTSQLVEGIRQGDRIALSRAITLCESKRAEDREKAQDIVKACLPLAGKSVRVGITGVPGVGKSTFIESFGLYLIQEQGKKVAVLAVDPSSNRSKGSILGDKTRMETLSIHPNAFIRPSPSSGSLGGVAHHSRESIILCEAAGFDTILVETVGVGQSETEVKEMTDFFLLLMLAGAGDELQGIKRGIMEMADLILINKADGDNLDHARNARREYQNALHLFPATESGWIPKVATCSALKSLNMDEAWKLLEAYLEKVQKSGFFEKQRKQQLRSWFLKSIDDLLRYTLHSNSSLKQQLLSLEKEVEQKERSPYEAAQLIFEAYKKYLMISET
jgi:LAO/AO transport system kinase